MYKTLSRNIQRRKDGVAIYGVRKTVFSGYTKAAGNAKRPRHKKKALRRRKSQRRLSVAPMTRMEVLEFGRRAASRKRVIREIWKAISHLKSLGITKMRDLVIGLNELGRRTAQGHRWSPKLIRLLIQQVAEVEKAKSLSKRRGAKRRRSKSTITKSKR